MKGYKRYDKNTIRLPRQHVYKYGGAAMRNRTETLLSKLLNKPCYIIDYLPETVPESRVKAFLEIEYYLLNSEKHSAIKDKFVSVIVNYSDL